MLHVPAPPRRSRPWSQGNLAGGTSADCRLALYGLLRTGRGHGSWATAPRPGYRQCTVHGAAGNHAGQRRGKVYTYRTRILTVYMYM
jgi:hypothetical protein